MFKDDDILKVYFGEGWKIDNNQECLGSGAYYQGVSKLVHEKLDSIPFKSYYIRWIYEDGIAILDFGSHSHFFKLVKVD